jgi:Ca2+:H+ antiporter
MNCSNFKLCINAPPLEDEDEEFPSKRYEALPSRRSSKSSRRSSLTHKRRSSKTRISVESKGFKNDCKKLAMILAEKKINLLILATIPAVVVALTKQSDIMIFTWNFVAMLPLASIIGDLTEGVASHLGESIGGVVNATFGNAVEIIVSIIAVKGGHTRVVQASLMGSIFSNILLVLGCALVAARPKKNCNEVKFNSLGASVPALILLMFGFVIMMTSYQAALDDEGNESYEVKITSRVGAILQMVIYIAYLILTLKTHTHYFIAEEEEEVEEDLSLPASVIALAFVTILVSVLSDFLVKAIHGVCDQTGMTETFLSVVLLPIIANAVEHWAAVTFAYKGKINLAMSISLGSSAQLALFVVPLAVLVGWIIGKDVTTGYPLFEVSLYIFSIVIVSFLVQQGRANWMYGLMLICIYGFIALAFWYEDVE